MSAKACLHLLCGKAGAGKSTLAEALAATHRAILISEDIWLSRLFGDEMKTFDTPGMFTHITSFFEPPDASEGFKIAVQR